MTGRIERRTSPKTGKVTYRVRVRLGKREGGPRWVAGGTYERLRPHGNAPCAETALKELLRSLAAPGPQTTSETVAELLEHWLRDAVRADRRANTVRDHEHSVRHILPPLGQVPAAELTPAQVAAWQAAQLQHGNRQTEGPCAPKSVRNYRGTLHACYAWALSLGIVPRNPVEAVPAPRLADAVVTVPELAEAQRYLAALRRTRLYAPVLLAATSGMRRGEVLALRWRDVDLGSGRVRVARQLTGSTREALAFTELKTRAGRRTITLPPAACTALAELRSERIGELPPGKAWSDDALICCGRRGQAIVPDQFTHELWRRLRRHKLAPLHLHALRHMVATALLRSGERMDVVAAHLGHAQVSTTLSVYAHVTPDDESAAAGRLQQAWEEAAATECSQSEPMEGTEANGAAGSCC